MSALLLDDAARGRRLVVFLLELIQLLDLVLRQLQLEAVEVLLNVLRIHRTWDDANALRGGVGHDDSLKHSRR